MQQVRLSIQQLSVMILSFLIVSVPSSSAQQNPASAVSSQPLTAAAAPATATPRDSGVLIGGGDLLEISVYGAPDFDKREVRVDSSGSITLPFINSVKVAGLSIGDAESLVAKRLTEGGYFNEPQVSILEKEYSTQGISVLGEVQKPGIYPLMGRRTLLDAISAAGGTTEKAGRTITIAHRDHPETPQTVSLSYSEGDHDVSNVEVQYGDTVVVSKAGIVYVVGDVKDPTGIIMENSHLTVLQALSMAHGANPTAKLGSARLIRNTPAGAQEIPIPLDKILSTKSPDLALAANDILFVPNSAAKSATRRGLEAMVQAITGMAVYGRY